MLAIALVAVVAGSAWFVRMHGHTAESRPVAAPVCQPVSGHGRVVMKDAYDQQVLSDGPAMYLTMGNSRTGSESDLSGNGHSGTYLPASNLPGSVNLPNGDPAAAFDGRSQYLQVSSTPSLSVTKTGCLTIQAWVRPKTLQFPNEVGSGYVYILGKGEAGRQEYTLRMYSKENTEVPVRPNRISAYVFNLAGGKGSGAYFQDKVQANTWMMITFVIDDQPSAAWPAGYIAIYKNDQLRGQVSIAQFNVKPHAATAPLRVATRQLQSFFEGAIGKVAVFDYVLSASQIASIYGAM